MSEVRKTKKASWFKGLKAEFNKIVWPNKKTLISESTTVIIAAVILGAIILVVDLFIKYGIDFIVK